jgi:hypothetical protein
MIATLPSSSTDALVKLLGMTGSHLGSEVATAAQKANALVRPLGPDMARHNCRAEALQSRSAQTTTNYDEDADDWRAMWRIEHTNRAATTKASSASEDDQ